jgi:hypothetical protein
MKQNYVDTDEVPQDVIQNDGGGGGTSNHNANSETKDNSLWWVAGFLLFLVILGVVLAII